MRNKNQGGNDKQRIATYVQANRLREAKALCRKLCDSSAMDPENWFMLGVIDSQLGLLDDAVMAYRKAIEFRADYFEAHYNLGHALMEANHEADAMTAFQEAIKLRPDSAEAHTNLGALHKKHDDIDAALACYRRAIHCNPGFALAHFNLGNALYAKREFEAAIASYRQAITLKPGYADAYGNMGDAFLKLFLRQEAMLHYTRALQLNPRDATTHNRLANVLSSLGKYAAALHHYGMAMELGCQDLEAVAGKALVYEKTGDIDRAYVLLRPYLESRTKHLGLAAAFANICHRVNRCPDAIAWLEEILADGLSEWNDEARLHFCLGDIFDRAGEFDKAFAHFERGNALKRVNFGASHHTGEMDALRRFFIPTMLTSLPRASNRSELPVFIVGMPRSGTTLVEQILASHPAVFGAGELEDINRLVRMLPSRLGSDSEYPQCLTNLGQELLDKMAQAYLDRLHGLADGALRVTDKMPHNFMSLGIIELMFPRARVIHCLRNPLDTCLSIHTHYDFNEHHGYAFDLRSLGAYYRKYLELMDHWRAVLSIPIFDLRYEDLISDQEGKSRALIEFCGLEWDPACLRFYENRRVANTMSHDQVRQPIYTKSIGRWKNYQRYLEPLKTAIEGVG